MSKLHHHPFAVVAVVGVVPPAAAAVHVDAVGAVGDAVTAGVWKEGRGGGWWRTRAATSGLS